MSIEYYNKESTVYSSRRYSGLTETYVNFFFKKRLSILLDYFRKDICDKKKKIDLLEVGCADGVLVRNLKKEFPDCFSKIVGIDIALEMIKVADRLSGDDITSFFVRGNEPRGKYDVIMAVGFLSLPMFKEDFPYIKNNLRKGGYFIWSLAGKNSLHTKIKLSGRGYVKGFCTFKEYEEFMSMNFEIVASEPYGLFVPKLWAFPSIARVLQPIFDWMFKRFLPELFHEKLYLLKLK